MVIEKAVSAIAETSAKARQGSLKKENEHPIFLYCRAATVSYLPHEVTQLSPSLPKIQEQLKEDDVECIVNQDELAMNYQEQATSPCSPPARLGLDKKASPQTPNKENIYEGDLGLGGYELKLEQTLGQSQLN